MALKFFLTLALLLSACAQPKYETPSLTGDTGQAQLKSDCSTRFSNSGLCLSWWWETKPTATEVGSLLFKVYRPNILDNSPVVTDIENPALVLWMPKMGHGSSPASVSRIDTGTYRATNVFFIMPGQWELRFGAEGGDEAVAPISF